jgi:hypothetical protein
MREHVESLIIVEYVTALAAVIAHRPDIRADRAVVDFYHYVVAKQKQFF